MEKIAVIGTGYVGLVSGTCFSEIGHQVICSDIDQSKIDQLNRGEIPIYEPGLEELVRNNVKQNKLFFTTDIPKAIKDSDIVYIAVGTPMSDTGEADLKYIQDVAKSIGENLNRYKVVVIKSTVPVGTGRWVQDIVKMNLLDKNIHFDIVSNPEFLREGSAINDCLNMERAVIGASSDHAAKIIKRLHAAFNTKVLVTDIESAEMIKYTANAFLATKISFINDIANICELVGADVTKVAAGIGLDNRIGDKFLQAGIGYGGSCFPKDTYALAHMADKAGYDFKLIKSVIETNENQPSRFLQKISDVLGDVKGKTIAVLGLAFKPNTNDMRCAPSLKIIPALSKMGANIKAFDPIANDEAKKYFGEQIGYFNDMYEAIKGSDVCLILTEWKEIMELDLTKTYKLLKNPVIFDGRNCFDPNKISVHGINYHSIGRQINGLLEHANSVKEENTEGWELEAI